MPRREELALAVQLDRVLDGREAGDDEVRELAQILELAAAPARFEVPQDEVERALARAPRPEAARTRRRPLAFAGAAAAVAGAVVLVLALTRGGGIGIDVAGRADAALGGPVDMLRLVERIEPVQVGRFPPSTRVGWLDDRRQRAIWHQYVGGRRVETTLLEHGRVTRYLLALNTAIVGPSCRAFASGCAELVDPVALYREGLRAGNADVTRRGGTYVLRLPAQELPDALRIDQVVTVDARTFRPLRIEWRTRRADGSEERFALIRILVARTVRRERWADALNLVLPTNVRVVQRVAPGRDLRRLGQRTLSRAEAAAVRPRLLWLGRDYNGRRAGETVEIRWNAGRAYRTRYGELTLWNYGRIVPPPVLSARFVPAKTIPLQRGAARGQLARFYVSDDRRLAVEVELGARAVAVVGPDLGKEDLFRVLESLQTLR